MIRSVFIVVLALHGLIHLMGFAKAFGHAELAQLTRPISKGMGALWLLAALLLLATSGAAWFWPRGWWILGALALLVSQGVIAASWSDAKFGTVANGLLLVGVLYGFASRGPWSLRAEFERCLHRPDPAAPAGTLLGEADLGALPEPVQRYVRRSGALGQPRIHSFRATWKGRIRGSATDPWMAFTAEQVNTFDTPRRFFMMNATKSGLPVDVLHAFDERGATMRVKLLSVVSMVDAKGAELTRGETVTLFNDLCILAPGALVSPHITWEPIDASKVRARFTLRANSIGAELHFNDRGELVDFVSDDRSAGSPDGSTFTRMRWTTPLSNYAKVGPARVATRGETVWHSASGAWTYGEFDLVSLAYNVVP
ncbi:MAG: hypothetical protein IPP58_15740 [Holophagaceae bacterium]|uniref:Uncharacterized protein n=1 Tax=Candidatus Geothrix skivensis TaxID=2954439 RepID=A0A9D7XMW9_9BACT|nr:hypothetical protein [Candidatus Geothrix skivensis]